MSDLIRRDDAIKMLDEYIKPFVGLTGDMGSGINGAREIIKSIPAAEPKVGEWIQDTSSLIAYRCTACGVLQHWSVIQDGRYHYCPNCGAKMKKGE